MTQSPTQTPTALQHIELGVTGMTCSSCSSRVQRKLNKLDGVDASVNFSTETAAVDFDASTTTPQMLIDEVRKAGYDAFEMTTDAPGEGDSGETGGASSSDKLDNARLEEADRLADDIVVTVNVLATSRYCPAHSRSVDCVRSVQRESGDDRRVPGVYR